MKDIYEKLLSEGITALQSLVDQSAQEGVSLEFKSKTDPTNGKFSREDKKNLGKTISAFSNSMGGLLVWGIECRKDDDGIDAAERLLPIKGIERFLTEANTLVGEYLHPRNEFINCSVITEPNDISKGYLLVSVLRSERRPHRSAAPGDAQYYKRVGASSYPMEHFDIEDAFRRTVSPELSFKYRIETRGGGSSGGANYTNLIIIMSIQNTSPTSGLYVYLAIESLSGAKIDEYGLDGNGRFGLPQQVALGNAIFGGGTDHSVHPGQTLDVVQLRIRALTAPIPAGLEIRSEIQRECVDPAETEVVFEYRLGCKDTQANSGTVRILSSEFMTSLQGT